MLVLKTGFLASRCMLKPPIFSDFPYSVADSKFAFTRVILSSWGKNRYGATKTR